MVLLLLPVLSPENPCLSHILLVTPGAVESCTCNCFLCSVFHTICECCLGSSPSSLPSKATGAVCLPGSASTPLVFLWPPCYLHRPLFLSHVFHKWSVPPPMNSCMLILHFCRQDFSPRPLLCLPWVIMTISQLAFPTGLLYVSIHPHPLPVLRQEFSHCSCVTHCFCIIQPLLCSAFLTFFPALSCLCPFLWAPKIIICHSL